jgi:hypothetical protein
MKNKKDKDVINVYWAPGYKKTFENPEDWSILYPDPVNLYTDLTKSRNLGAKTDSFLVCPATKDLFKKTYVFKNVINCKYEYDFSGNNNIITPLTEEFLHSFVNREPSITTGPLIRIALSYVLFADQPLLTTFTNPTFSKPEYTKYGTPVPGEFDIGQWFRPYTMEMQMWDKKGTFELKENEPLVYAKFNTDKEIKLHRFNLNDDLWGYIDHCIAYKVLFGPIKPLAERYNKFKQSRLADTILTEIKKNVVGGNNES